MVAIEYVLEWTCRTQLEMRQYIISWRMDRKGMQGERSSSIFSLREDVSVF